MKGFVPTRKAAIISLLLLFLLLELVLYVLIQTVPQEYFGIPAYLSIILVFSFSCASFFTERQKYSYLVNLALAFTLGADFCLVVLDPAREAQGVVIFIAAQLSYFLYILIRERGRLFLVHTAVRLAVTVLAALLPFMILGDSADTLSVISVIYYSELVLNLVFSLFDRELRLFSAGLVLFALCDLSIGLDNLSDYFNVGESGFIYSITHTGLNMAWIFYLPSQVLIAASLIKWRRLK
ncbi:MAG: hypothetical protein IJW48_04880 [Clostridia bacterium]|nr:hypothetical protein [Clostridia bacterium]